MIAEFADERVDPRDRRAARAAALQRLAQRDHSTVELRRKILDKGFDPAVLDDLIDRLTVEGILDDRRYVATIIRIRADRGQGPLRLRSELVKLGLAGELVDEALSAFPDWMNQLHRTRQKKFGAQLPTHYSDKQRQAKFLAYRGYTGGQIGLGLGYDIDLDAVNE